MFLFHKTPNVCTGAGSNNGVGISFSFSKFIDFVALLGLMKQEKLDVKAMG